MEKSQSRSEMTLRRRVVLMLATLLALALPASMAEAKIASQWVDYKEGDTALQGYLAYDDAETGKRPGVLLVHARDGMSAVTIRNTEMVARLGYVVFAPDIFGKEIRPKDIPEMNAQSTIYNKDRPLMRARAAAGFEVLRQNPMVDAGKIAILGYCFGGTVSVEYAETGAPIVGLVTIHGSFRNFTPGAAKNIKGRVLILHGAEDTVSPIAEVNTMIDDLRAAKIGWQLDLYSGAEHGFSNPKNPAEERADAESRDSMGRFFKEIFGP